MNRREREIVERLRAQGQHEAADQIEQNAPRRGRPPVVPHELRADLGEAIFTGTLDESSPLARHIPEDPEVWERIRAAKGVRSAADDLTAEVLDGVQAGGRRVQLARHRLRPTWQWRAFRDAIVQVCQHALAKRTTRN